MVSFLILNTPCKSKGWARYACSKAGIQSRTGNPFVYAEHEGKADPGTVLTVDIQVGLRVGKGASSREEQSERTFTLVADDWGVCDIEYKPGSQGMKLRVVGARPPRVDSRNWPEVVAAITVAVLASGDAVPDGVPEPATDATDGSVYFKSGSKRMSVQVCQDGGWVVNWYRYNADGDLDAVHHLADETFPGGLQAAITDAIGRADAILAGGK